MSKQKKTVDYIIQHYAKKNPALKTATAFAPSNIALVKYWGKRDEDLKLPVTSSLSISLADYGAKTTLSFLSGQQDEVFLNGKSVDLQTEFYQRISLFLDLFRQPGQYYHLETQLNIPAAAGLASSACGFAALVLALNKLHQWGLDKPELSVLARLGSGSAARSLWHGFVEWQKGEQADGLDSFAKPLVEQMPDLCVGLLIFTTAAKPIGSTQAMKITQESSTLYKDWPARVEGDLLAIKQAIRAKDFKSLGKIAESNAIAMHQTMRAATPGIDYSASQTREAIAKVQALRQQGCCVYFTQDAGPNIKLLFLKAERQRIASIFPEALVLIPFA